MFVCISFAKIPCRNPFSWPRSRYTNLSYTPHRHNTFIIAMSKYYRKGMMTKGRFVSIFVVTIMVISILGITVPNYFSVNDQFLSIDVVSQNSTPLQNVSVQGDIIAPISSHTGWNTIFSGITSSSGKFSTSNLTSLMKFGKEWKSALGPLITGLHSCWKRLGSRVSSTKSSGIIPREWRRGLQLPNR